MQGIGNDFIAFQRDWLSGLNPSELAPALCNHHTGIGADGVIVIGPSPNPDCAFDFVMFNPDGSPDMCGNGLRCATLLAYRTGLLSIPTKQFTVTTPAGVHTCESLTLAEDLAECTVKVEMGTPSFDPAQIPVDPCILVPGHLTFDLQIGSLTFTLTSVSTGSTHSVIFVDELPSDDLFFEISPQIEVHPAFPERTSIMWTKRTGESAFQICIWERGAGETLGCGTGGCAVAAAALATGRAAFGMDITVTSKGGTLTINWPSPTSPILMSGSAKWVFEGGVIIL
jgi:diaminopimelate epimerase